MNIVTETKNFECTNEFIKLLVTKIDFFFKWSAGHELTTSVLKHIREQSVTRHLSNKFNLLYTAKVGDNELMVIGILL